MEKVAEVETAHRVFERWVDDYSVLRTSTATKVNVEAKTRECTRIDEQFMPRLDEQFMPGLDERFMPVLRAAARSSKVLRDIQGPSFDWARWVFEENLSGETRCPIW